MKYVIHPAPEEEIRAIYAPSIQVLVQQMFADSKGIFFGGGGAIRFFVGLLEEYNSIFPHEKCE